MKYYSTNHSAPLVGLEDAVIHSLAPDNGLYMPERIPVLPPEVVKSMKDKTFQEIGDIVAQALFAEDVEPQALTDIVYDTLSFDTPIKWMHGMFVRNICALELFHGPTMAFKDVGARFMARMLGYFIRRRGMTREVNVLVATSGDTGSAVANGFLDVPGIKVFVLYPKNKVTKLQESQFATLGRNITAVEVEGTFDDCQALVKSAFLDADLNAKMQLTSANSINVARLLPQAFYYFNGYAKLPDENRAKRIVFSVPCGNLGNLTAGLIAWKMGLPVNEFVAANNSNNVFFKYLETGEYKPQPAIETVANAMDVGNPSNFARILDLFGGDYNAIKRQIKGCYVNDYTIWRTVLDYYAEHGYMPDPHGACALQPLSKYWGDTTRIFLETADCAKFREVIAKAIHVNVPIPPKLEAFMKGKKQSVPMPNDFAAFKDYLMSR